MDDGLYRVQFTKPSPATVAKVPESNSTVLNTANSAQFAPSSLWHDRLGHSCTEVLERVLKTCNIPVKKNCVQRVCIACQLGKAHKLPFTASKTMYSSPFELVVSNVWGPAWLPSNGFRYYVSFVDMYSRYTWVYFLQNKSEVARCFRDFYRLVKVQFRSSIKMLQTDGGGEYRVLARELSSLGVQHRITCPYTSEQNGVTERKHRQLIDMALSLLAHANLPLKFWFYAVMHAVHLTNRLPTPVLGQTSPYEVLHKVKPSYELLSVFGCACFPNLRPFQHHKLSFRSQQCVFLGSVPNTKGYRCLAEDGSMFVSRHVIFYENKFPFKDGFQTKAVSQSLRTVPYRSVLPVVSAGSLHVHATARASASSSTIGTSPGQSHHNPTVSPAPTGEQSPHDPSLSRNSPSPLAAGLEISDPPDRSDLSPSLPTRVNHHPMQTRSKSGIFRPKVLASVLDEVEPTTIHEAFQSPAWTAAAKEEYNALISNHTWDLVGLPEGRRAVGCKWLFCIKRHADGSVVRYKGRLVVKGYLQEAGVDFQETFNPVVKPTTIRVVLALAVSHQWSLRQVDINNAFLNEDLSEEIYMSQQPGFEQYSLHGEPIVCKLKKALYGLKQALRAWFQKLRDFLVAMGFDTSKVDSSIFIRH